jgi:hypothetical protein
MLGKSELNTAYIQKDKALYFDQSGPVNLGSLPTSLTSTTFTLTLFL